MSDDPKIVHGFRMAHDKAEHATRQQIITRAFDWVPQGNRIAVVEDQVPDRVGSILIPIETQDVQQMGTGWIISVGPAAGLYQHAAAGNIAPDEEAGPEDLLGLHVMYGFHAGKAIRFSIFDGDYDSQIILLAPVDIWMVDYSDDPWTEDATYEEAFRIKGEENEQRQRTEAQEEQEIAAKRNAARERKTRLLK